MKYTIKKGDTISQIAQELGLDWRKIWSDPNNESNEDLGTRLRNGELLRNVDGTLIRKPEWIQPGQILFVPETDGIGRKDSKADVPVGCIVRREIDLISVPRFDAHCHIHVNSIAQARVLCSWPEYQNLPELLSDANRDLLCNSETANLMSLLDSRANAIVPMMLDMSVAPMCILPGVDWQSKWLQHDAQQFSGLAKAPGSHVAFDPYDIYPNGLYISSQDDWVRWRNALSKVSFDSPGRCFPFAPFDPRQPKSLERVKHSIKFYGFIGINLYTRLGWRFKDNHLLVGNRETGRILDKAVAEMFDWAAANSIPVMNHASPGGMPPNELIAFPKGLRRFHDACVALTQWEQDWVKRRPKADGELPIYGLGVWPRLHSCGRIVDAIASIFRHANNLDAVQIVTKENISSGAVVAGLSCPEFSLLEKRSWLRLAESVADAYMKDLQDFIQLTVDPDLSAVPQGLRYCFAHAGSEVIFADEEVFISRLGANSKKKLFNFRTQNFAHWFDSDYLKRKLSESSDRFLDLSSFTNADNIGDRLFVIRYLLTWLAKNNFTKRVIFGTDWQIAVVKDGHTLFGPWKEVREAAESEELRTIWPNCWNEITKLNSLRFLGFDDECLKQSSDIERIISRLEGFWGRDKYEKTWLYDRYGYRGSKEMPSQSMTLVLDTSQLKAVEKSIPGSDLYHEIIFSKNQLDIDPVQTGLPRSSDLALIFNQNNIDTGAGVGVNSGSVVSGSTLALKGQIAVRIAGSDYFLSLNKHPLDKYAGPDSTLLALTEKKSIELGKRSGNAIQKIRLDIHPLPVKELKRQGLRGMKGIRLPHWNITENIGQIRGLQVTDHAVTQSARLTRIGVVLFKLGGRFLFIAGAAQSAWQIYHAKDQREEFSIQAAGWVASAPAGGYGCAVGAEAGAALGLLAGGIGAVPGSFLGCLAGGAVLGGAGWYLGTTAASLASKVGESLGRMTAEWMFEPLEKEEWFLIEGEDGT